MSTRSSVLCKERFKQRSEVMNPNMRIHENLVTERHQESQHEKTQHILTLTQHIDFNSFAGALRYLHACLNGAILDTLRAYSKSREIPLPEPGEPGELQIEDDLESSEIWDNLKLVLPKGDELRLAYLLFHC